MEQARAHNTVTDSHAGTIVQIGSAGTVTVCAATNQASPAVPETEAWVRLVTQSPVWAHVPVARDTGYHRQHVAAVVRRLAEQRDALSRKLVNDPWQDPDFASRFLGQVEWLLGEPGPAPGLDLYPAEAAVLVLAPFLQQVHYARRAVLHLQVRPEDLGRDPAPDRLRSSYQAFLGGHERLTERARRHSGAEASVGWWLFHRWLTRHQEFANIDSVAGLLDELGPSTVDLGDALAARRILSLLLALRRGPDVGNPEFFGGLPDDDRVRSGPGHQQIRDQRASLLLSLAHTLALPAISLPPVIAEHLTTPHPVDLAELRHCLESATWGGSPELPVLRAEGRHEAVVEALRKYTVRADEQLHAVRRTVRERVAQPMPTLPVRLSDAQVTAAGDVFTDHARFRADGQRVLGLAMGVQLYKDRDLAVRELYQNALDACRLRRARTEYLGRTRNGTAPFEGRICFVQGIDKDGRRYLDCTDNGIGMSDAELRGVFSQAGERFAEQADFLLERAEWEALDPPISLYLNSRFGIGVLSYFMLADDIRITTCRMGRDGALGTVFDVAIHGPEHLFRITTTDRRPTEPGTRIRLYLREELPDGWSVVGVLQRLLGIAEFETTAQNDTEDDSETWQPGRMKSRKKPYNASDMEFNAHGALVPAPNPADGVQVVWCENGGGLLVDGLVVGLPSGTDNSGQPVFDLEGVVVNLTGVHAPANLSSDRRTVLEDVSPLLRELLAAATAVLPTAQGKVPGYVWLSTMARHNSELAELVTVRLTKAGRTLQHSGLRFGTERTGWFLEDISLVRSPVVPDSAALDHIYLWRVLAHRPPETLRLLTAVCPELAHPVRLRVPSLSDAHVLNRRLSYGSNHRWLRSETGLPELERLSRQTSTPLEVLVKRYAPLGIPQNAPPSWQQGAPSPDEPLTLEQGWQWAYPRVGKPVGIRQLSILATENAVAPEEAAACLRRFGYPVPDRFVSFLANAADDRMLWSTLKAGLGTVLDPDTPVPPGHVANARDVLGLSATEIRKHLESHGLQVDARGLPPRLSEFDWLLLSVDGDGEPPWNDRAVPVTPALVLWMAECSGRSPGDVAARLVRLGFSLSAPLPPDADAADLDQFLEPFEDSDRPNPIPLFQLPFHLRDTLDAVRENIRVFQKYGYAERMVLPDRFTDLDRELLCNGTSGLWWGLEVGQPVPFARIVLAAKSLGESPAHIAARLRELGISTSHQNFPPGLSGSAALRMLRSEDFDEDWTPEPNNFPLQHLVWTALDRECDLEQVVSWLNDLGIPVPDPGETVRAALARVPRA